MFNFYIENHKSCGSLIKNGSHLGKDKSIVSTFSVIVVCKSAVISIQKNNWASDISEYQGTALPNYIGIKHYFDIFLTPQSWLD